MSSLEVWQEAFPPGQIIHAKRNTLVTHFGFTDPVLPSPIQFHVKASEKSSKCEVQLTVRKTIIMLAAHPGISQRYITPSLLLSHAHPRSLGERNEPFLQGYRILLEPAFGIKGFGVLEDGFGLVHKGAAHSHDGLRSVSG